MRLLFVFLFICFNLIALSQQDDILTLKTKLQKATGKHKIKILQDLSVAYRFKDPKSAEKYAFEAYDESISFQDSLGEIISLRIIGASKEYLTQYDSSLYYFTKSAEVAEKYGFDKEIILSNTNKALIFIHQNNYKKAIEIYKNSLTLLKDDIDPKISASIYNNIGTAYSLINEMDSAKFYLTQATDIKYASGDMIGYAISLTNIADIFSKTNELDSVDLYLHNALKIFEKEKSTYNIAYSYIKLADLNSKKSDLEKSSLFLKQALIETDKIKSAQLKSDIYQRLSELYKKDNNYENALKYYVLFDDIQDSLNTINNSEMVNEIKLAYEFDLLNEQLATSEKELELEKNKNIALGITLFLVIIVLVILLLVRRKIMFKNTKIVEQISKQSPILEQQSNLKEKQTNDNGELQTLFDSILFELETNTVYKNPKLNISEFSTILNSNTTYVSKAINQYSNGNFKTLINEYRVKEAIRLLSIPDNEKYTLATISELSGFSSISVFNRTFKESTGVTPSFFLKTIKEKSK